MVWDYEFFTQKIYELTSIDLTSYKERQMKRRINSLIARNDFNGYEDYYNQLLLDNELLEEFVRYITLNVSEFFEIPNSGGIRRKYNAYVIQKHERLKIWSAACSTGKNLILLL